MLVVHPIVRKLEGGDRRSLGRAPEIVAEAIDDPDLFKALVSCLLSDDPLVRMRAADAMEKVSARHPEYLQSHKGFLIGQAAESAQKEVRWHLAQMLPRLALSPKEARQVVALMIRYFEDASSIVKTNAMQALADLAGSHPALRPSVMLHLRELTAIGTPAMKARGRMLLAAMAGKPRRRSRSSSA